MLIKYLKGCVATIEGAKSLAVELQIIDTKLPAQFNMPAVTTNLVSRILFLNYHLSAFVITGEMLLPTLYLERAALKTVLYMALQHPRFTHALHCCSAL